MENTASALETLIERVESYGKVTLELTRLKALGAVSRVMAGLGVRIGVFVFLSLFMIIVSLGVALWLGEVMGKIYYGFFVVAGFYFLVSILVHFVFHKWMKKWLTRIIIKQIFQ